ncbi:MAG: phosphate ABC transporter ATP-binding protein [Planctomycetes bacterium]|nr:phosphate ABC transporter ATP-binding protein [Planctomycetota bacterium]
MAADGSGAAVALPEARPVAPPPPRLRTTELRVRSGEREVLKGIDLHVHRGEILAVIGPAGAGKTTFLRCLNRMNDLDLEARVSGQVWLDGHPVYDRGVDVSLLRRRVGMVLSTPIPLPGTIWQNMTFGLSLAAAAGDERHAGGLSWTERWLLRVARLVRAVSVPVPFQAELPTEPEAAPLPGERYSVVVEASLRSAYLWDEVKDRLHEPARNLSGGQQQRLCLARALSLSPDVLLLDEPCSGLDPISTAKIEEALQTLKRELAIVLVTNNVKQAARASDRTAFFLFGEAIEVAPTATLFTNPREPRTAEYISGRFG